MNKQPFSAVFIDLDGTLLSRDGSVSPRNTACLKTLLARGVHIVFATGRPIESIRQLVSHIHVTDPVISLSGSMIHQSMFGDVLSAQVIPFETMHSMLEACRKIDGVANILLDESDGFYALVDDPVLDEFIGMYGQAPRLFDYDSIPSRPVLSILIHARAERRQIYELLQERFGESVHFTYFREYPWIELSAFESNKGNAMETVCRHLGLDVQQVIAIGDGANDLEMIARAGLGVAMENGDDEVKAVADRQAPPCGMDGLAIILEEIFSL